MTATAEPAIDPTLLALLYIFGGAAVTVVVGLIAARIQRKWTDKTWLRNERLEVYAEMLRVVDLVADLFKETTALTETIDRLQAEAAKAAVTPENAAEAKSVLAALKASSGKLEPLGDRVNFVNGKVRLIASPEVFLKANQIALAIAAGGIAHKDAIRDFVEVARKDLGLGTAISRKTSTDPEAIRWTE